MTRSFQVSSCGLLLSHSIRKQTTTYKNNEVNEYKNITTKNYKHIYRILDI